MPNYINESTILASSHYQRRAKVDVEASKSFKIKTTSLIAPENYLQVVVEFEFESIGKDLKNQISCDIAYIGIFIQSEEEINKDSAESFAKNEGTKILYSLIKSHFYDLLLKSSSFHFPLPELIPNDSEFHFIEKS